jgi:hypothetical protein
LIASARLTRWSTGAARVLAFNAWQDPGEAGDFSQDATTAALLSLLECDKHKDVRRAVVASVGVSCATIPALVERTRDNAEEVRRTAFLTLAAKVPLSSLSIAARATLLRRGLADRAPDVRDAAVVLLGKWLNGACARTAQACAPLLVKLHSRAVITPFPRLVPHRVRSLRWRRCAPAGRPGRGDARGA